MVKTVGDGLAYIYGNTGNEGQPLPDVCHYFSLRMSIHVVSHFKVCIGWQFRMFVHFRPSGAPSGKPDTIYFQQFLFDNGADFVGFFKRSAWGCGVIDGEGTFVERWQKFSSEKGY